MIIVTVLFNNYHYNHHQYRGKISFYCNVKLEKILNGSQQILSLVICSTLNEEIAGFREPPPPTSIKYIVYTPLVCIK